MDYVTQNIRGIPQYVQTNFGAVPGTGKTRFLSHPLQLIIH